MTARRWRLLRRLAILVAGLALAGLVLAQPALFPGLLAAGAILAGLEILLAATRRAAFPLDEPEDQAR